MIKTPFVEASQRGGKQRPFRITLRTSMTTSTEGSALAVALYWHQSNAKESCHYVVDEAKAYQCVPDKRQATHAPSGTLVLNLCAEPKHSQLNWESPQEAQVLSLAAELVARLVISYRIPLRYVTGDEEYKWYMGRKRSQGGIVLDLKGDWPREHFLAEVRYRMMQNRKERHV